MIGERFRDLASFAATPRRRQCGATLLEIAVAVVIFTALIGAAFTVVLRSQDHIFDEVNLITLNDKLSRTVARLAEELAEASPSSVLPVILDGSDNVTFNKVTGYSAGAVQIGPENKFEFQLATGETLNGSDDNGDDLVDEGVVVFTVDGDSTTIVDNVLSLSFTATATGIEFNVAVGAVIQDGQVVTRTLSRTVSFRN